MAKNATGYCRQYLASLEFPARRGDILAAARRGSAPRHIYRTLEQLPEGDYEEVADVVGGLEKLRNK